MCKILVIVLFLVEVEVEEMVSLVEQDPQVQLVE
jgi:hypothetical protein